MTQRASSKGPGPGKSATRLPASATVWSPSTMADASGSDTDASSSADTVRAMMRERFQQAISEMVPHNRAIGMKFEAMDAARVTTRLPYDDKLVGNPATGVLHGGAITTLMDATCGSAVFLKLLEPIPIATLDLRIDYLKPATAGQDVLARAECLKVTENVAFVRCEAYHGGREDDLIAVANGTFMIFRDKTRSKSR